jgi:hypothetical protein
MERIEDARSGEILDDNKEMSKKKKSKIAQYISSRFSKLFSERDTQEREKNESNDKQSFRGRLLELFGVEGEA